MLQKNSTMVDQIPAALRNSMDDAGCSLRKLPNSSSGEREGRVTTSDGYLGPWQLFGPQMVPMTWFHQR